MGRAAEPSGPTQGEEQGVGPEALPYLPEPLDDRVVWAVAVLVDGMLSPVVHVHVAEAAHQQLEGRDPL